MTFKAFSMEHGHIEEGRTWGEGGVSEGWIYQMNKNFDKFEELFVSMYVFRDI